MADILYLESKSQIKAKAREAPKSPPASLKGDGISPSVLQPLPPTPRTQLKFQLLPTGSPPSTSQNNSTHIIDTTGQIAPPGPWPKVTATLWEDEGSLCFQVDAKGICVARRDDNHMINGTKLLIVAGIPRGRRDSILKSEKTRHVAKIGPRHLRGVWIPYERALDLANRENIVGLLYPLFVHNIGGLLFHPLNQGPANAVVAASERRRLSDGQGQYALITSGTQPPTLTHHHAIHKCFDDITVNTQYPTPPTSRVDSGIKSGHRREETSNLLESNSLSTDSRLLSALSTLAPMTSGPPSPTQRLSEDPSLDCVPTPAKSQIPSAKNPTPRTTQRTASPVSYASNRSFYEPSGGGVGKRAESLVRGNQGHKPLSIDKGLGNSRSNPTTPATTPSGALKPVKVNDEFSESPFEDLLNSGPRSPSHQGIQFALYALAEKEQNTKQIGTVQDENACEFPSMNVENLSSFGGQLESRQLSVGSQGNLIRACDHRLAGKDQSHDVGSTDFARKNRNQTWSSKQHYTKLSTEVRMLLLDGEYGEDEGKTLSQSATDQASTTTGNLTESDSRGGSSSPCLSIAQSQCSADDKDRPIIRLSLRKRELVDQLMAAFYTMFDPNSRLRDHAGSSSSCPRRSTSNGSNMSASALGSGNGGRKRKASDDILPTRDGDGGDEGKKGRKLSSSNPDVVEASKKFACPYFKRNPRKYQRVRSCPGPGWDTVHRLKEHLYRRHALPLRCPRCCEPFVSDAVLRDHHKAIQSCEVRLEESIEGFDKDQERMLKCRKKSSPAQSEEDRWRDIYRILFPEDESSELPSPYYDYDLVLDHQNNNSPRSTGFAGYEEFLSRELPRQVRRELELALNQELEPIEDRLKSQLVDIVSACQEKLFRLYQKTAGNPSSITTGNGPGIAHSDPPSSLLAPVQPSSSTINIDVDEHLTSYLGPPYSDSDQWPQMDEDCVFPWQLLENNETSDSGYYSSDWLSQSVPNPSQDHNSAASNSEKLGHP